jgi:hypothetical protein
LSLLGWEMKICAPSVTMEKARSGMSLVTA